MAESGRLADDGDATAETETKDVKINQQTDRENGNKNDRQ